MAKSLMAKLLKTTDDTDIHGWGRRRAALGQAKPALRFQISSQASWHGIVKSRRSLASRAALLFAPCARCRNCQELASRKNTGHARLAGMAGFLKRHLQACLRGNLQKSCSIRAANKARDFSASPSVLIRAIRGLKNNSFRSQ